MRNSKGSGSMRASIWPRRTSVLKSACSAVTVPGTCDPTCTVSTAPTVPVAVIALVSVPRSTMAVRYCSSSAGGCSESQPA